MKNIIFITSTIPYINGSGLEQRCCRNIVSLQKFANVSLIIIGEHNNTKAIRLHLINFHLKNVHFLKENIKKQDDSSFIGMTLIKVISSLFNNKVQFNKASLDEVLSLLHATEQFDVFVFRLQNFNVYEGIFKHFQHKHRLFLDWDDIESITLKRVTSTNKNVVGKEVYWANQLLIWKLKKLEQKTVDKSHSIFVCSKADANSMGELYRTQKFFSIPNSCDFQKKQNKPIIENQNDVDVIFVGSMYYPPNEHGALWFCNEVLPIINAATDLKINVWIIGYKPSEKVRQLAHISNVTVTGSVDSVAEYYHKGSFAIAPIHFGGGTRIKILEAASYNLATVTTTIGVEGIEYNHMKEVLIADTPQSFAKCCIQLAEDYKLRSSLSDAALLKGERLYDHLAVGQQLQKLILGGTAFDRC